jgi:rod shape-determining protein MreD
MTNPDLYAEPVRLRLRLVPILSVLAGSLLNLVPVVALSPTMPPFGLLMALAWRLRRPELWAPWVALPLGLFDDLVSGAALGQAATLWTIAFMLADAAEHLPLWRDYWLDWALASGALLFCIVGGWAVAGMTGGGGPIWLVVPQLALAILLFPAAAWLGAALDGWRLRR